MREIELTVNEDGDDTCVYVRIQDGEAHTQVVLDSQVTADLDELGRVVGILIRDANFIGTGSKLRDRGGAREWIHGAPHI